MRKFLSRTALVLTALLFLVGAQTPIIPVEGKPIRFAADHNGTNTKAYRLFVNGSQIGADTPVSALSSGVIEIQIAGLSAGTHKAELAAVGTDGSVVKSTPLTFTVVPVTTFAIKTPSMLRVELPTPPTDPDDTLIDGQTAWGASFNGSFTLTDVPVKAGRTVLVGVLHTNTGAVTYTVSDGSQTLALVGQANVSATNPQGVYVWKANATNADGVRSFNIKASATTANFRASALVLNVTGMDATTWTEVEPAQVADHRCGPTPWTFQQEGMALCLVTTVSGSISSLTVTNADKVLPGIGTGGWFAGTGDQNEDAAILFTSAPARRFAKVALRIW